jgi:tetratricopeptide (TPR) repeat protein
MVNRSAEDAFTRGLAALGNGRGREALALFEAAIEIEKRFGAPQPQARYLSFYGLCLALEKRQLNEGIRFCKQALDQEFFNPDLCCNLGRLLFRAGRRKDAYEVLLKGYSLQPSHQGIFEELSRMGMRRRPVLAFLSRNNPINIILGKMTRAGAEGAR